MLELIRNFWRTSPIGEFLNPPICTCEKCCPPFDTEKELAEPFVI
jgi:hypothetical protein